MDNKWSDNYFEKKVLLASLQEERLLNNQQKITVQIGTIWSVDLAQKLLDLYPQLVDEEYTFSTISQLMIRASDKKYVGTGN